MSMELFANTGSPYGALSTLAITPTPTPTYVIRVFDINGRCHITEDTIGPAREWLWRTLSRMTNDGQEPPYGHRFEIEFLKTT